MRKPPALTPVSKLHVRYCNEDGRCSTLIAWDDGEWKVEIFASVEHAIKFAKENKLEVIRHDEEG